MLSLLTDDSFADDESLSELAVCMIFLSILSLDQLQKIFHSQIESSCGKYAMRPKV